MKKEYDACSNIGPFRPARPWPAIRSMRRPAEEDRCTSPRTAAPVLDAANAVYALMLRTLVALYDNPPATQRSSLVAATWR